MRRDLESVNISKERMRGFSREEIKCWGCQAPFCGHRIMSLVDGKAMAVCSLRESSREVLGMVNTAILDHNFTGSELMGLTRRDLACNNCKGKSCGYKGMRIVDGKAMRVCLEVEKNRQILGLETTDGAQYIEGQDYRVRC